MVGENIKAAREAKGLTQEELGRKIGVTGVTIMRYEKSQRKPSLDVLFQLSDALGVSVSSLAGVEESPLASISETEIEHQYSSLDPITKVSSILQGMSYEDREKIIAFIEKLSFKNDTELWHEASESDMHRMGILQFKSDDDRAAFFYSRLNTDGMLMAGKCFFKHLKAEDMATVADYVERLAETPQYQRPQEPGEDKK